MKRELVSERQGTDDMKRALSSLQATKPGDDEAREGETMKNAGEEKRADATVEPALSRPRPEKKGARLERSQAYTPGQTV